MSNDEKNFGICGECGTTLVAAYSAEEEQVLINGVLTPNRKRCRAIDYLNCPMCGKHYTVDNSL